MAKNLEHQEQCAVIQWKYYNLGRFPELDLLHAIPNGGARNKIVAAKLKREGVKAGVCDLFLPVARQGFHGLYIELKIKPNKPTDNQKKFINSVKEQGYMAVVCYSADEIIEVLENYLK